MNPPSPGKTPTKPAVQADATGEETALAANRDAWDLLTPVHVPSDFYGTQAVKAGACSLKPVELALAGEVKGVRLLHLQCHFGLDSLSWARRGADVTGVDFSLPAIETARALAAECTVPAQFLVSDVQQLPEPAEPFDLAVTTYGVLCWVADLDAWADGIRRSLRPGGRLVVVDFHPLLEVLYPGKMTGAGGYFGSRDARATLTHGTYADPGAAIEYREYRWQHTLADIVGALLRVGLDVADFQEYPYSSYPLFDELDEERDGLWFSSAGPASHPFMFSLVAHRGADA